MRGLIYLAAGLLGATPALASPAYSWTSGSDTTASISTTATDGKALVLHGDTALVAYGIPAIYAESWSGPYPAITAVGGTGLRAIANNIQGAAAVGVDATGPLYGVRGEAEYGGGTGVLGTANGEGYSVGVHGIANAYYGVGVKGESEEGVAIKGVSTYNNGVEGTGIYRGIAGNSTGSWYDYGVSGQGTMGGVYGQGLYNGVRGYASEGGGNGVVGEVDGEYAIGVQGSAWNTGAYAGVFYGNVAVWGDCDPCSPSDSRFKKNVKPLAGSLGKVMSLKPKTYEMKVEEFKGANFSKGTKYGLMADDLLEVMPEIVHTVRAPAQKDAKGLPIRGAVGEEYKAVAYSRLIPVLIGAIQELQAEIDALKKAR